MEKTAETIPVKNVDEYLSGVPENVRPVLEKLRQTIKEAAPDAEELISYRVPTYKQNGPLVHFVVHKNHCSLIVVNKEILKTFEKELQTFETSGTTIHFTPGKTIPATLVKKIVRIRIKENEDRMGANKPNTKRKN